MFKTYIFICLLLTGCFTSLSKAIEVDDLYLVKRPIAQQSKSARWKATLSGFKEVLIRKSGSEAILKDLQVQQSYSKVTNYLQRFEYSRQSERDEDFPFVISLYFEPRLIDSLIRDAKMPLWGSNRPVTILWLAVQDSQGRRVVTEAQRSENNGHIPSKDRAETKTVIQSISENSIRRGVPIITPLMDLEDEMLVSVSDIWGRFAAPVSQASTRYSADSILFGRMVQLSESWTAKLNYLNQGTETSFEIEGDTKEEVISNIADRLAELLCSKYCVIEEVGEKNKILMDVADIGSFKEYKEAKEYLSSLSSVRHAEVIKIEQRHVIFELTLLGQIESITKGISLSQKMLKLDAPKSSDRENPELKPEGGDPSPDEFRLNEIHVDEIQQKPALVKSLFYRWVG